MSKFERVKKRLEDEWGLLLRRNSPDSRGWWKGCWKTGYSVSGMFPGTLHTDRRYDSLEQIIRAMDDTLKSYKGDSI